MARVTIIWIMELRWTRFVPAFRTKLSPSLRWAHCDTYKQPMQHFTQFNEYFQVYFSQHHTSYPLTLYGPRLDGLFVNELYNVLINCFQYFFFFAMSTSCFNISLKIFVSLITFHNELPRIGRMRNWNCVNYVWSPSVAAIEKLAHLFTFNY